MDTRITSHAVSYTHLACAIDIIVKKRRDYVICTAILVHAALCIASWVCKLMNPLKNDFFLFDYLNEPVFLMPFVVLIYIFERKKRNAS